MEMSEFEICQSYRLAKNKHEQIKILAELNLCSKTEIQQIIQKAEDRKKAEEVLKEVEIKPVVQPIKTKKNKNIPESVLKVLTGQLENLDKEIGNLHKAIKEKEEQYKDIAQFLIES